MFQEERLAWRKKHSDLIQKAGALQKEPKDYTHADINYAVASVGIAATTRDYIEAAKYRLCKAKEVIAPKRMCLYESGLQKMIPVQPELESLRIQKGRKAYLKKRYELSPDEKYVFPETSNWTYGWRPEDFEVKPEAPRYPRIPVMKNILYSNVGPQPDPSHYKNPSNVTFCSRFN